jgi:ubiquinone biosynthesis monooxygenase Coq7
MTNNSHHSLLDRCLIQFDQALRTCVPGSSQARRISPADKLSSSEPGEPELNEPELNEPVLNEPVLNEKERRHVAGLMRINHTGEVCAQALYQGQAATARLEDVRESMSEAAAEEVDHLAWCEARLEQLESRPSVLNPLWYALSYGVGAAAGIAGDKWSLGFVAETEEQVCEHLEHHLKQLPAQDEKSRAILEQMIKDEKQHGATARDAGGAKLPTPVKLAMTAMSKLMKTTTYRV